jgi:nicotinamidase-related amidase
MKHMHQTILLVVDVQEEMIMDQPYNYQKVIENISKLITKARTSHMEVVYVRHDDGEGSPMGYGKPGWQIYHEIEPADGEKIFDKRFNSAFRQTALKEYLDSKDINTIMLAGLQTEYCIDTSIKCAFEFGYEIIVPEETNSTYDCKYLSAKELYQFYNYHIWNKRFARVIPMDEALNLI